MERGMRSLTKTIISIRNVKMCSYFNSPRIIDEATTSAPTLEPPGSRDTETLCTQNWLEIRTDDSAGRSEGGKGTMLVGFLIQEVQWLAQKQSSLCTQNCPQGHGFLPFWAGTLSRFWALALYPVPQHPEEVLLLGALTHPGSLNHGSMVTPGAAGLWGDLRQPGSQERQDSVRDSKGR